MLNINADTITQAVIARHAGASDVRLREVMTSLVQHLHAFARDVRLNEDEWRRGLQFLHEAGSRSAGGQAEFVLLSDLLGLSALVAAQSGRGGRTDVPLPLWSGRETRVPGRPAADAPQAPGTPDRAPGTLTDAHGSDALPCFVQGRIRDLAGAGIAGARLCVWQLAPGQSSIRYRPAGADDAPVATATAPREDATLLASLCTDAQGRYAGRLHLSTASPAPALPDDGPAAALMQALGRGLDRPTHLQCAIHAPGCTPLVTQIFPADGPALGTDADAVFAARPGLLAPWQCHGPGTAPDGSAQSRGFRSLSFDFALEPRA